MTTKYHDVMAHEFTDRKGFSPILSTSSKESLELEHDWVLLTVARDPAIQRRAESQINEWERAAETVDPHSTEREYRVRMSDVCRIMCGQEIKRHVCKSDIGYLTIGVAMHAIAGPNQ